MTKEILIKVIVPEECQDINPEIIFHDFINDVQCDWKMELIGAGSEPEKK